MEEKVNTEATPEVVSAGEGLGVVAEEATEEIAEEATESSNGEYLVISVATQGGRVILKRRAFVFYDII